jgi:flagellar hook-basal body complex protein FliE
MTGPILPVSPSRVVETPIPGVAPSKPGKFQALLDSAMQKVEDSRAQAEKATESFLQGDGRDVHSVLLDVQRAELTFDLFVQVRNKVVQAYQEIMRMPL